MSNETMTDARALQVLERRIAERHEDCQTRKALEHAAGRLRGEAAQPACPNDDTGAAQLHRHNVFVYEVDFGDEGKGQYVRLADFNRVAALVTPAAPAPVAGGAVTPDMAHRFMAAYEDVMMSERKAGDDHSIREYDAVIAGLTAAFAKDRASQGCGACGDGCRSREACRLADESPSQVAAAGVPDAISVPRWFVEKLARDVGDIGMPKMEASLRAMLAAAPSAPTQGAEREVK